MACRKIVNVTREEKFYIFLCQGQINIDVQSTMIAIKM